MSPADSWTVAADEPDQISLIYFFAPWCGVCRVSMSNLREIQRYMPNVRIQIIALDYGSADEVGDFVRRLGIETPVFLGSDEVRQAWRVTAYPSYFVVDGRLIIRGKSVGYSTTLGMMFKLFWVKMFY